MAVMEIACPPWKEYHFATGDTLLCGVICEQDKHITMHIVQLKYVFNSHVSAEKDKYILGTTCIVTVHIALWKEDK